jgi:hypothetical protein
LTKLNDIQKNMENMVKQAPKHVHLCSWKPDIQKQKALIVYFHF